MRWCYKKSAKLSAAWITVYCSPLEMHCKTTLARLHWQDCTTRVHWRECTTKTHWAVRRATAQLHNLNRIGQSAGAQTVAHCKLHTTHFMLHNAHWTLNTELLHYIQYTLCMAHCTIFTIHCTVHIAKKKHCTVACAQGLVEGGISPSCLH